VRRVVTRRVVSRRYADTTRVIPRVDVTRRLALNLVMGVGQMDSPEVTFADLRRRHAESKRGSTGSDTHTDKIGPRSRGGVNLTQEVADGSNVAVGQAVCEENGVGTLHSLVDGVARRAVDGVSQTRSITERLESKFGLGECPEKRRKLYRRLERLVRMHGDSAYTCIAEAVAQAVAISPRKQAGAARYFCKAVLAKIREANFPLGAEGGDPSF
jgi:hypothetical protein